MIRNKAPKAGLRTSSRKLLTRLGAVAAAGALLLTTACAAQTGTAPATTATGDAKPASLTIAVPFAAGAPGGMPLWLGDKLGYFKEENLTVKFVNFPGKPAEAVGLVVAGQADLTITAPDTIIVPTAKGDNQGLKWIFTPYQRPSFAIAVPEDSDITSAKDLAGKNIGMPSQGPPFETFMAANIKADGGEATGTKVTVLPVSPAMESLRKGDVGAYIANRAELKLAAELTGTKVRVLEMPDSVEQGLAAGVMMRADSTD